jgi:hypothetical protein
MVFRSEETEHDPGLLAATVTRALGEAFDQFGWTNLSRPPVAAPSVVDTGEDVLIDFAHVDEQDQFRRLLQLLVPRLTQYDLEGLLLCAQPTRPHLSLPLVSVNSMVLGMALPTQMDFAGRPPTQNGWYAPDDLTNRILDYGLDWIAPTGSQIYVELNDEAEKASRDDAIGLAKGSLYPITQTSAFAFNDTGFRRLTLSDHGHVNFEIGECNEVWQPAVAGFTELLRHWAADCRYGLIRRAQGPGTGWSMTIGTMAPAPEIFASYTVIAPGLEDRLVPDPYGVQLVTSRHLDTLRPPESWRVEPVANDRFLLSDPAPEQWFDIGRPYRSTLQAARERFGSAVIHNSDVNQVRRAVGGI